MPVKHPFEKKCQEFVQLIDNNKNQLIAIGETDMNDKVGTLLSMRFREYVSSQIKPGQLFNQQMVELFNKHSVLDLVNDKIAVSLFNLLIKPSHMVKRNDVSADKLVTHYMFNSNRLSVDKLEALDVVLKNKTNFGHRGKTPLATLNTEVFHQGIYSSFFLIDRSNHTRFNFNLDAIFI
jgi:hypothetical protein